MRHARRICGAPGCAQLEPCPVHPPRPAWRTSAGVSRQRRGYDAAHEAMRRRVFDEEPCCALCGRQGQGGDHLDHVRPKAQGGSDERANLRRVCDSCHRTKSSREGAQARARIA